MTKLVEARDAIAKVVNDGWTTDAATSSYTLLWDDVEGDKPGFDGSGDTIPYGRCTIRHITGEIESLGGEGQGKEEHQGIVAVQCFGPKGRGYRDTAPIAQAVKRFFQRQVIPLVDAGRFFDVVANELPNEGDHDMITVSAAFAYSETVGE